jgi:hypothetical protein
MALSLERLTNFAGVTPARGTFPIKANVRIFKGAMVALDSAGRAMPAGLISAGALAAVGKASATYDNRTGSELGGSAAACNVEVEFGVFGWLSATGGGDDIAADDVGKVCFMKDDQTVALTSDTDTRGIAGFITEVRDGQVYVYMGPHVAGLIVIAASEASQLDTAQTDIAALEVDAATSNASFGIPLTSFLDADGDPLAKFVADNVGTCGFNLADTEALNLRWNNYPGNAGVTIVTQFAIPADLDGGEDMLIEFLCSKSGATVGDATKITYAAYFVSEGDLHDADTAVTGDTAALVGNATAKTTDLLVATIGAADVPAAGTTVTLKIFPKSGTIETDDFMIHSVRVRYTRAIQVA